MARARGVKLGNLNGVEAFRRAGKGAAALRMAVAAKASRHAKDLAKVIDAIRARSVTTLRRIAAELNVGGKRTRRGGQWRLWNVRTTLPA